MSDDIENDKTKSNPFDFFDFSLEEAIKTDAALTAHRNRDARICACGHPMARHTNVGGIVFCKPTRMECPCKASRAVLEVSDVRMFLRRTDGGGSMHALGRGLQASVVKGCEVSWLIDMQCDRCRKPGRVSPVPVTQNGYASTYATGFDALLCADCRVEV
jgi:hypothetical protein